MYSIRFQIRGACFTLGASLEWIIADVEKALGDGIERLYVAIGTHMRVIDCDPQQAISIACALQQRTEVQYVDVASSILDRVQAHCTAEQWVEYVLARDELESIFALMQHAEAGMALSAFQEAATSIDMLVWPKRLMVAQALAAALQEPAGLSRERLNCIWRADGRASWWAGLLSLIDDAPAA